MHHYLGYEDQEAKEREEGEDIDYCAIGPQPWGSGGVRAQKSDVGGQTRVWWSMLLPLLRQMKTIIQTTARLAATWNLRLAAAGAG